MSQSAPPTFTETPMQLTFHTLDVFTDTRFGGNPLAVVLDADGLDTARMQAIAREFNLSETVFVLKPENPAHSARLRIFTPTAELPFAGHPTVGTAAMLAKLRMPADARMEQSIVLLEEGIGAVRVGVRVREGQAAFAEFDAPRLPEAIGRITSKERVAAALGLIPSEIGFENHLPARFAAGVSFAFVPVATLEAIAKARPNLAHWSAAFGGQGLVGAFLYTRQCIHTTSAFHARMFAPDSGIVEDPATGSAAIGLAGAIQEFDALPDGLHKRAIEQGYEMERPSHIQLTLDVAKGRLRTVRIGGQVVEVSAGRMTV
jgi:trans-2,3-dihydro-3-hydroxyanthranilate isomerase